MKKLVSLPKAARISAVILAIYILIPALFGGPGVWFCPLGCRQFHLKSENVSNLYLRSGRNGKMYPVEQGTEEFDAIIDSLNSFRRLAWIYLPAGGWSYAVVFDYNGQTYQYVLDKNFTRAAVFFFFDTKDSLQKITDLVDIRYEESRQKYLQEEARRDSIYAWAKEKGLIDFGLYDYYMSSKISVTEVYSILYRYTVGQAGENEAFLWATEMGLLDTTETQMQLSERECTREEAAHALWVLKGSPVVTEEEQPFLYDNEGFDSRYETAVRWSELNGLLGRENGGMLWPKLGLNHEEFIVMLYKAFEKGTPLLTHPVPFAVPPDMIQ